MFDCTGNSSQMLTLFTNESWRIRFYGNLDELVSKTFKAELKDSPRSDAIPFFTFLTDGNPAAQGTIDVAQEEIVSGDETLYDVATMDAIKTLTAAFAPGVYWLDILDTTVANNPRNLGQLPILIKRGISRNS